MRQKLSILATSLFILSGCAAIPSTHAAVGEWSGKLETGAQPLMLIVNIDETEAGTLTGHLETPEQVPGKQFPFDKIDSTDGNLRFELHQMGAAYEATWNAGENQWDGEWLQAGIELPLVLTEGRPELPGAISGLDGDWQGHVMRGNNKIMLSLTVQSNEGMTVGKFASPTNGISGLPVKELTRDGDQVSFGIPATGASYQGILSDDGTSMTGDWSFRGNIDTVTFTKN